jgi:hypothetical protein
MECPAEHLDRLVSALLEARSSTMSLIKLEKLFFRVLSALIAKNQWRSSHVERVVIFFRDNYRVVNLGLAVVRSSIGSCSNLELQ